MTLQLHLSVHKMLINNINLESTRIILKCSLQHFVEYEIPNIKIRHCIGSVNFRTSPVIHHPPTNLLIPYYKVHNASIMN